jgi:hypothetical protein
VTKFTAHLRRSRAMAVSRSAPFKSRRGPRTDDGRGSVSSPLAVRSDASSASCAPMPSPRLQSPPIAEDAEEPAPVCEY